MCMMSSSPSLWMVTAKEETSERLHCIHAMVWNTEIEADVRQSRNWFVFMNYDILLCSLSLSLSLSLSISLFAAFQLL